MLLQLANNRKYIVQSSIKIRIKRCSNLLHFLQNIQQNDKPNSLFTRSTFSDLAAFVAKTFRTFLANHLSWECQTFRKTSRAKTWASPKPSSISSRTSAKPVIRTRPVISRCVKSIPIPFARWRCVIHLPTDICDDKCFVCVCVCVFSADDPCAGHASSGLWNGSRANEISRHHVGNVRDDQSAILEYM